LFLCLYVSNFSFLSTAAFDTLRDIKKIMRRLLIIILLATASGAGAQKVDGHWYGIGMIQTSHTYQSYLSEMILKQKGKNVSGALLYYFRDSLIKVNISGSFDVNTRRVSIKPFPMIYYLSPTVQNSIDCNMSGNFLLTVSKAESILNGSLKPDADHKYTVPDINLRLVRSDDTLDWVRTEEPELPAKKDTVIAPAVVAPIILVPAPDMPIQDAFSKREKIYSKEIEVTETRLRLEIYDNGQVDYDSVTLFFNNRIILPKSKLDHRAIRLTIDLDLSLEDNELSMFADNLGMVPPNTAALVIYDGKERHETLLSSDLSKSATIRLRRKK
jgi:hypothetical protein